MIKLPFQLSNEQRKYLGLIPVEPHWELVELVGSYVYFDGDVIRKKIHFNDDGYYECELNELTAENRTLLMPKTAKGKPKKLNYTATLSFKPFGVYVKLSPTYVSIANYTTQTTFFECSFDESEQIEDLSVWIEQWIQDSTEQDLKEIQAFKIATRQHQKYKEGNFFAFKIGRREWGFGRILIDVAKLKKDKNFKDNKNYGLTNLMGKSLIIKIYHKIQNSKKIDLNELAQMPSLPAQAMMDNHFFYAENPIIGHLDLENTDFEDILISYHPSISGMDQDTVYLQYGLIYKEMSKAEHQHFIDHWQGNLIIPEHRYFRNEGIGFGIHTEHLRSCIEQDSNQSIWDEELKYGAFDLRAPNLHEIKREIFSAFGLDADISYAENLQIFLAEQHQ